MIYYDVGYDVMVTIPSMALDIYKTLRHEIWMLIGDASVRRF